MKLLTGTNVLRIIPEIFANRISPFADSCNAKSIVAELFAGFGYNLQFSTLSVDLHASK